MSPFYFLYWNILLQSIKKINNFLRMKTHLQEMAPQKAEIQVKVKTKVGKVSEQEEVFWQVIVLIKKCLPFKPQ